MTSRLEVWGVSGLPEVVPGDDLAALIARCEPGLANGDVVVVTSKIVSKAEGRLVAGTREQHLAGETVRLVAERGDTRIVETRHGFVMAAAGIDASNVPAGMVALLPVEPDASAGRIRDGIRERCGVDVAVIVSDTMGRPWREGVTDVAIGAAGIEVLSDLRGERDTTGNLLEATVVAVADELAAATDLVKGKLTSTPVAIVRGFPLRRNGSSESSDPGARPLVRRAHDDMFRLGSREAGHQIVADSAPVAVSGVVDVAKVRRAVDAVTTDDVTLTVDDDGGLVVATGDPLAVGVVIGRLLGALAAEGLRAQWPAPEATEGATTAIRVGRPI